MELKQKLSDLSIADLLGLENKYLRVYQELKLNEFRDKLEAIQNILSKKIGNIDWNN